MSVESSSSETLLKGILQELVALRKENVQLASAVDGINGRVNTLAGIKQIKDEAKDVASDSVSQPAQAEVSQSDKSVEAVSKEYDEPSSTVDPSARRTSVSKISKIILTSYPGQAGVDPLPMEWGHKDPAIRGPVVVSRHPNTIRRRNGTVTIFSNAFNSTDETCDSYRCPRRLLLDLQCSSRS